MPQNIFIVFLLIIMVAGCSTKQSHQPKTNKPKIVVMPQKQPEISTIENNIDEEIQPNQIQDNSRSATQIANLIKTAAIDICKGLNDIKTSCDYDFQIENPQDKAPKNPLNIFITSEMMSFVQNDTELAILMGHEYAHNILADSVKINKGKLTKASESEADYLGLYITARAGYEISQAPQLWRKIASPTLNKIFAGTAHPSSSERFLNLEKSLTEINRKKHNGAILAPSVKK